MRAPGAAPERMLAYVVAWAHRRGVALVPGGLALAVGSPLRRQLERRLIARAGRSAVSLGPLLTGAAAGAMLNRRETRRARGRGPQGPPAPDAAGGWLARLTGPPGYGSRASPGSASQPVMARTTRMYCGTLSSRTRCAGHAPS